MRKTLLFCLILLFSEGICSAQPNELDNLKASLSRIKDSLRYIDAINRIGMLMYERNVDSTFYYGKKAREMAWRLKYKKGEADALNNLGIFFDLKGNTQLALRYYNDAYQLYKKQKDSVNSIQTLMNIGMVYKEIGKDDKAKQWFKASLKEGKKLSKDSIMSLVIYNYLLLYPAALGRDSMRYYLNKARNIAIKYKDERTLVAVGQLIADDRISHGNRTEGLALLDTTITEALNKKLYYVSMDMLIDMGSQLIKTDPVKAARYYQKGLDISEKNGYLIYNELLARKLFDLYTSAGDNVKASIYSKQLIRVHDEQQKINNESGVDYLDYALKEEQVKSLKQRSKYQNILLILVVLACFLAVSVLLIIRHNLKRVKHLNKQIINQNSQMRETLVALEQSQNDNTRMMKIAAHDLRNPIGAITSLAGIMLDHPDREDEERTMLEMIKEASQNSLELVSDLLQTQFKTDELTKEPVDLGEMLRYCVSLLQNKAEAKGQEIKLQTQALTVPASREKLWRVMSNLIANAIKFSPEGGVIDIQMVPKAESVLISVKDNGIGIPPEMKDRIFDMFTNAKRTGTAGEQAFGLGLAISKQIVEAHSGSIWFESSPGEQTTFFVDLPFAS
jgi:signal transduction histidine kinase